MKTDTSGIEYRSVIISERGIEERAGVLAPLCLPREKIKEIELTRGWGAERPIVGLILGFAVLAVCASFFLNFLDWLRYGGTLYVETLLPLVFLPLGLWLIAHALRRRIFLLVHTETEKRKVVFKGHVDLTELSQFIARAREELGYYIVSRL